MAADRHPEHGALRRALALLAETGIVPLAAAALDHTMENMRSMLRDAVLADVSAFSQSGNPDVLPQLEQHGGEKPSRNPAAIGRRRGWRLRVRQDTAQRRAAQRFPLEAPSTPTDAAIKSCPVGCAMRPLPRAERNLENGIAAINDFVTEYTNTVSSITTAEYVDCIRALAEAEGDRRSELFNILLNGYDEFDVRVARLLKRAGYLEQRQAYCICAVQPINALEMENPARAQRIATALSESLAAASIRMLVGTRNNAVVAVISARRRQSGWTAPQANLAERIHPMLLVLGPAVLVGVSGRSSIHVVSANSPAGGDDCARFCQRGEPRRAILQSADPRSTGSSRR